MSAKTRNPPASSIWLLQLLSTPSQISDVEGLREARVSSQSPAFST